MAKRGMKMLAAACAVAALCAPLAACGSSSSSSADKEVIINTTANATTAVTVNYNPFSSLSVTGTMGGLYEAMFYTNSYGTKGLEPLLGTEYTMADDGMSVNVTLRDDVTWSDGEKVTADDVVYTFELLTSNDALNTVGFHGTAEKVSDTEVKLTFEEPQAANGLNFLTGVYIVPKHVWESKSDPVTDTNEDAVTYGILTTEGGNFDSMAYTLKTNANYYGGAPEVDGVRFVVYSSDQSKQDALLAGELDWAALNIVNADSVLAGKDISTVNLPSSQVSLITCSNSDLGCTGPITDKAVRKAIYYGINRKQLNKLAFNSSYTEINGSLYPTQQYQEYFDESVSDGPVPMNARQDEAIALLEAAGYTKGSDGIYEKDGQKLSFEVAVTNGTSDWINAVDIMNQQLKDIGIEFITKQVSSNEWGQGLRKGDYDLTIYGLWMPNATEAYGFYNQWFNGEKTAPKGETAYPGYARYDNAEVNQALKTINSTTDETEKQEAYTTIQENVFEDMPYIPLLRQSGLTEFWSDKFDNFPTEDNLYANPQPWASPDYAVVLKNLTVK